jgi:hypothetical protein
LIHSLTFAGAIHVTLAMLCIVVGLIQFHFICWSYVSPISAAAIQIAVRLAPPMTRGQIGLASFVLSIVVMTIAYVLIGKHRPPADAPPASTRLAEHGGVPS